MPRTYRWLWGAGLLVVAIAVALAVYSCGSSSKSTNPYGGGGGGAELGSGNIASGTTFSHTFATAGTYPYHCTIHAGMTGTVVVNAGGSTLDTTFTMVTGNPYPTIVCKTGGTVHWNNPSGTTHTVTSN